MLYKVGHIYWPAHIKYKRSLRLKRSADQLLAIIIYSHQHYIYDSSWGRRRISLMQRAFGDIKVLLLCFLYSPTQTYILLYGENNYNMYAHRNFKFFLSRFQPCTAHTIDEKCNATSLLLCYEFIT
jgi:hypothetical protein